MYRKLGPFLFLCLGLLMGSLAGQAQAAKRVALVVGNDAYQQVPNLKKAVNDARAIGAALEGIGFTVLTAENLSRRDMNRQLQLFVSRLEVGDEAVFFFAGHGVEIAGRNYLLPTDIPGAQPGQEDFVKAEAIPVDQILDMIRARGTRVSILMLDACRDNPFPKAGTRSLGGGRGLARTVAPEGTFIMYSAGVGQTALDRLSDGDANPNSVFTRSLIPLLQTPGVSLVQAARAVRRNVQKLAATISHDQRPAYYDEVTGDFFFAGRGDGQAPAQGAGFGAEKVAALQERLRELEQRLERQAQTPKDEEPKVAIGVFPEQPSADAQAVMRRCDALAADPDDEEAKAASAAGVPDWKLRAAAAEAVEACQAACSARPGERRYAYQLGRALYLAVRFPQALEAIEKAAQAGHIGAMKLLASWYETPHAGLSRDPQRARTLYLTAAEAGDADAMASLAGLLWQGKGGARDRRQAYDWFAKAAKLREERAEAGDTDAMRSLSLMYETGTGVPKDPQRSFAWLLKAAEAGDEEAMDNVAFSYEYGTRGQSKNDSSKQYWERRRFESLARRAGEGDAEAMDDLGWLYMLGEGVAEDEPEAVRWFIRSAEAGYDIAASNIAFAYANGYGVAADKLEADRWYRRAKAWERKAAEAGDGSALYEVGNGHSNGDGEPKSATQAARYYQQAFERGYAFAGWGMAQLYEAGDDYPDWQKSNAEAVRWLERCAEAGGDCLSTLAANLDKGVGVPADRARAADYYLRYLEDQTYLSDYQLDYIRDASSGVHAEVQRRLKEAGFYSDAIDGKFGPATRRALEQYARRL